MKLEDEIKTQFKNEYHKMIVNVLFTQNYIDKQIAGILKPHGIGTQQYNVLRILRGQHPKPCNINLLIDRMLDKMSNASRLVDKLVAKSLVERTRNEKDRRNVDVTITDKGMELLKIIEPEIDGFSASFKHMNKHEVMRLNELLDLFRCR